MRAPTSPRAPASGRTPSCRCCSATSSALHAGFLVAILAAVFVWWLMTRSTWGFRFRAVGSNPSAARTAGMAVSSSFVLVMVVSGALTGLAGAVQVLGTEKALTAVSPGRSASTRSPSRSSAAPSTRDLLRRSALRGPQRRWPGDGRCDGHVDQHRPRHPVPRRPLHRGAAADPFDLPAPDPACSHEGCQRMTATDVLVGDVSTVSAKRAYRLPIVLGAFGLLSLVVSVSSARRRDDHLRSVDLDRLRDLRPRRAAHPHHRRDPLGRRAAARRVLLPAGPSGPQGRHLGDGAVRGPLGPHLPVVGLWPTRAPPSSACCRARSCSPCRSPSVRSAVLLNERAGVVNIAIEGQLLTGAFGAAVLGSVTGTRTSGSSRHLSQVCSSARCSRSSPSSTRSTRSSSVWCSTSSRWV